MVRTPEATRERIVAAALDCFGRYGFKRTTMEDVAAAAGVGKGTVYLHFTDKDALFETCIVKKAHELNVAAMKGVDEEPDAFGKLSRMLRNVVQVVDDDRMLNGILRQDSELGTPHLSYVIAACHDQAIDMIAEVLRQGVAAGEIRNVNTRLAAFMLFTLYESYFLGRHPGERPGTSEEFIALAERMVRHGLSVGAPDGRDGRG